MIRRFITRRLNRTNSDDSQDSTDMVTLSSSTPASPRPPPASAFLFEKTANDSAAPKVEELSRFEACVEACDNLTATSSTASGRIDEVTGLVDCSVLVSPDGDLMLIPQKLQTKSPKRDSVSGGDSSVAADDTENSIETVETPLSYDATYLRELRRVDEEYESAIFMGNDLLPGGDKTLNGFSAKGWSIPAATLALKQTHDSMGALENFAEEFVLAKKASAARESQIVDLLRPLADAQCQSPEKVKDYQEFLQTTLPDRNLEVLPTRVGPLSSPGGTVHATMVALEQYYSTISESESNRWREASRQTGLLTRLRKAKGKTEQRALSRQKALHEMFKRAREKELQLMKCKEEAANRWDAVHEAEETVTRLVEAKMLERSRLREQQRLEQFKQDETKRSQDRASGDFGATSSEIWDIVSAVASSLEEGSFEPMDLPQAPLSAPRDQSQRDDDNNDDNASNSTSNNGDGKSTEDDQQSSMPIASRHELEQECGLPELRLAALAADEAVDDVSNSLLNVLSSLDTTTRSARIAVETYLVSACNAQASCLRKLIEIERASIDERYRQLKELEAVAENMDVRMDMNHYITLDKKEKGGRSILDDDDDGGVASALAVLSSHIDGNMGMGSTNKMVMDTSGSEDESMTPERMEEAVERFFEKNPLLGSDVNQDDEATKKALSDFEETVQLLCKAGDVSGGARSQRSTICYVLNSKRSIQKEITSSTQFEGLCRVFAAILSGCDCEGSGVSLAKMLMMLSQTFYVKKGVHNPTTGSSSSPKTDDEKQTTALEKSDSIDSTDSRSNRIYVKDRLLEHPLWQNDQFWDQALYQCVTESLTHSGVMDNFSGSSNRIVSTIEKKKSEWTETHKMRWHDLKEQERYEAASQVHAVVFAQLGALAHSMIEFGCGLERSCAFVRRMAIRNQLPISQRTMLLQHLMGRGGGMEEEPVKLTTPSR